MIGPEWLIAALTRKLRLDDRIVALVGTDTDDDVRVYNPAPPTYEVMGCTPDDYQFIVFSISPIDEEFQFVFGPTVAVESFDVDVEMYANGDRSDDNRESKTVVMEGIDLINTVLGSTLDDDALPDWATIHIRPLGPAEQPTQSRETNGWQIKRSYNVWIRPVTA